LATSGRIINSLFLDNPIGARLVNTRHAPRSIEFTGNLIVGSEECRPGLPGGVAIWVDHPHRVTVERNIWTGQPRRIPGGAGLLVVLGSEALDNRVRIQRNIAFHWQGVPVRIIGPRTGLHISKNAFGAGPNSWRYSAPSCSIDSYLHSLGKEGGVEYFLREAKARLEEDWQFTAPAVISHVRAGFRKTFRR
jgi:hypothetical protein